MRRLVTLTLLVGLFACSGNDELKQDGGATDLGPDAAATDLPLPDLAPDLPRPDLPAPDAGLPELGADFFSAGDMTSFTCSKDCYDYVVDRVLLPMTSSTAQQYALVFKGKKYNALGNILALLAQQAPGLDVQTSMDEAVCSGKTIDLLRVKAASLTSTPAALGHSWVGADAKCCTGSTCLDPYNKAKCSAAAKAKCFNGSGAFKPDPKYPKAMLLFGSITAKKLSLGPAKLIVRISLSSLGSMDLALLGATITGTVDKNGITSGVLAGAIPQNVLNNSVMPNIAQILNSILADPLISSTAKAMIKTLFDNNSDGKISIAEVKGNALIKTFLAGDVDIDGDGKNELSVGLGFTAVKGKITP